MSIENPEFSYLFPIMLAHGIAVVNNNEEKKSGEIYIIVLYIGGIISTK